MLEGSRAREVRMSKPQSGRQVAVKASFDDLVVPPSVMSQLQAIAAQLRQRSAVRGQRGAGIAALFAGESGKSKSMAAEAIAKAMGLDLYRVDLPGIVSKYIGETEKNLARLFDEAEDGGAILLFDEADALFGKRGEVKDSHDRYANIEVSYLLQRIERHPGLTILATSSKQALDSAFLRRLQFVVEFPVPDVHAREQIRRRQM